MAEWSDDKMDDPLNLMRVMPPKGSQPSFSVDDYEEKFERR
jgi:hypothetical protein